jgi:hypothetical protein
MLLPATEEIKFSLPLPWRRRKPRLLMESFSPLRPLKDPESIYLIIEDQAFSPSYELAPSPSPPTPHPSVSSTGDTGRRLRKRDNLLTEEMEVGEGEEDKSYDGEKAWSSIIQ